MNGTISLTSAGVSRRVPSIPHDGRRGHPALQLLDPLGRPGDLDAAGLVEDAELLVLAGAVDA